MRIVEARIYASESFRSTRVRKDSEIMMRGRNSFDGMVFVVFPNARRITKAWIRLFVYRTDYNLGYCEFYRCSLPASLNPRVVYVVPEEDFTQTEEVLERVEVMETLRELAQ